MSDLEKALLPSQPEAQHPPVSRRSLCPSFSLLTAVGCCAFLFCNHFTPHGANRPTGQSGNHETHAFLHSPDQPTKQVVHLESHILLHGVVQPTSLGVHQETCPDNKWGPMLEPRWVFDALLPSKGWIESSAAATASVCYARAWPARALVRALHLGALPLVGDHLLAFSEAAGPPRLLPTWEDTAGGTTPEEVQARDAFWTPILAANVAALPASASLWHTFLSTAAQRDPLAAVVATVGIFGVAWWHSLAALALLATLAAFETSGMHWCSPFAQETIDRCRETLESCRSWSGGCQHLLMLFVTYHLVHKLFIYCLVDMAVAHGYIDLASGINWELWYWWVRWILAFVNLTAGAKYLSFYADRRRSPLGWNAASTVWLGNIPEGATHEEIKARFEAAGTVKPVQLIKQGKEGFALFSTPEEAQTAITKFNGDEANGQKIGKKIGQKIEVDPWTKIEVTAVPGMLESSSADVVMLLVPGMGSDITMAKGWIFVGLCFHSAQCSTSPDRIYRLGVLGAASLVSICLPMVVNLSASSEVDLRNFVGSHWPIATAAVAAPSNADVQSPSCLRRLLEFLSPSACWNACIMKAIQQVTEPKYRTVLWHDVPQGACELVYAATMGTSPFIVFALFTSFAKVISFPFIRRYLASYIENFGTVDMLTLFVQSHGSRFSNGRSGLHAAAAAKEDRFPPARVVGTLLALGEKVTAEDRSGQTPLHKAASATWVGALLAARAQVHARDKSGLTPLHAAAQSGHAGAVQALLQRAGPSSIAFPDYSGQTPLHLVFLDLCTRHVAAVDALQSALPKDKEYERELKRALALPNNDGRSPLGEAAYNGNVPACKFLLAAGAERARGNLWENKTPVVCAIEAEKESGKYGVGAYKGRPLVHIMREAGFSAQEMFDAGFSEQELENAGYDVDGIKAHEDQEGAGQKVIYQKTPIQPRRLPIQDNAWGPVRLPIPDNAWGPKVDEEEDEEEEAAETVNQEVERLRKESEEAVRLMEEERLRKDEAVRLSNQAKEEVKRLRKEAAEAARLRIQAQKEVDRLRMDFRPRMDDGIPEVDRLRMENDQAERQFSKRVEFAGCQRDADVCPALSARSFGCGSEHF